MRTFATPSRSLGGLRVPAGRIRPAVGFRGADRSLGRSEVQQILHGPASPELTFPDFIFPDSTLLDRGSGRLPAQPPMPPPSGADRGGVRPRGVSSIPDGLDLVQRKDDKTTYVPYRVRVTEPMTPEEFKAAASRQIFGAELSGLVWHNLKDSYVPASSPYIVQVDVRLLKQQRGQASRERGISVEPGGGVAGAAERAKEFQAAPGSAEKAALMQEIDRRYFEAIGDPTHAEIKRGEKGKAELWRMIRDEVLFQHEYIANLPPKVKELIKFSIHGKDLTPADYDKLFVIAKKIEKMPTGQVADYASKVTGTTTDLDVFEASLDKYIAEMAARQKEAEEHEKVQTRLIGLEEIYKKYRLYKTLLKSGSAPGAGIVAIREAGKLRQEIEKDLQPHGFAGLPDFEALIEKFEQGFEQESLNIAKDLLAKYAGTLYRESERYKNPSEVATLYQRLAGFRAQYAEFETNATIWNDYKKASEQGRLPGQGHLRPKIGPSEAEAARKKAETAKAAAQSQIAGLSSAYPIFQEEGLPVDRRIDKVTLAKASAIELGGLLRGHVAKRMKAVDDARSEIEGRPELIYKMDKLMPQFYAQQGIRPGSIHDMILQDKMHEDAILKLVKGVALAIVAIALAVVSFGTATPAIVAAGAAIAGAGLGAYMALEEYQQYTQEKKLADVGLIDDPSMVWLIVAVVGATLDMAVAVKAVRALGPAAKALNAGGDLSDFTKAVRALEKANEIEGKIARAAENAAAARKGFAEASTELTRAMAGKVYSFPGPLADPDVYKAVVKMARQAIKTKIYDAQKFIEELKLARVRAGLGDLAPEELEKAKQAWEEAKALEAADQASYQRLLQQIPDATKLDALIAKAGDAAKLERLLKVFPEAELDTIFAQLTEPGRLVNILDQAGAETGAGMIRGWMAKGAKGYSKMNLFLERLAAGGRELSETAAVGAKSVIIDSNAAIALVKDADPTLRATMQEGEKAWVAYLKTLPSDTELRVANVTVGEIQGGVINVKGVPITVARESTDYQKVLKALADQKVGAGKGAADRGLIADAFFAKTDPGVVPRLVTGDTNAVKNLARIATPPIDVVKAGGYPGLAAHYGKTGFEVTIEGRKLLIVPLPVAP